MIVQPTSITAGTAAISSRLRKLCIAVVVLRCFTEYYRASCIAESACLGLGLLRVLRQLACFVLRSPSVEYTMSARLRESKATTAKHAQLLREMLKRPENKLCVDCKRNGASPRRPACPAAPTCIIGNMS